jgi:hypothetical protein
MYKSIIVASAFIAVGTFFIYGGISALRSGEVGNRFSSYERREEPFSFWFYVVFYILFGLFAYRMAVYVLLHPPKT